jgi:hypothetical protein
MQTFVIIWWQNTVEQSLSISIAKARLHELMVNDRWSVKQGCESMKTLSYANFLLMIYGIPSSATIPVKFWRFVPITIVIPMILLTEKLYHSGRKTQSTRSPIILWKWMFNSHLSSFPTLRPISNSGVNYSFQGTLECQNIFTKCFFLLKISK